MEQLVLGIMHFVVKRPVDNMIALLGNKITGDEYTAFLKSGEETCWKHDYTIEW